jgi:hypothetical protein
VNLSGLTARCRRLNDLHIGLQREMALIGEGNDPLLYRERQDYLAALRDAVHGLESARVVLAKARQRLEQPPRE